MTECLWPREADLGAPGELRCCRLTSPSESLSGSANFRERESWGLWLEETVEEHSRVSRMTRCHSHVAEGTRRTRAARSAATPQVPGTRHREASSPSGVSVRLPSPAASQDLVFIFLCQQGD